MELAELIVAEAVAPSLKATSKKQLLQELAARASDAHALDSRTVFEALMERERLGATGMGHGVAIPHARLHGVDRILGYFARLDKGVDYDSADGEPVDLVFLLLAPESAGANHLKALARVSRLLRNEGRCAKIRSTTDASAIYAILTEELSTRAA